MALNAIKHASAGGGTEKKIIVNGNGYAMHVSGDTYNISFFDTLLVTKIRNPSSYNGNFHLMDGGGYAGGSYKTWIVNAGQEVEVNLTATHMSIYSEGTRGPYYEVYYA